MDNNLFRKVDKNVVSKTSKYEQFGFTRNPFPKHPGVIMNNPDNRQNGTIYLRELRTSEETQFENILVPDESKLETKSIAFLMDYATRKGRGIGKTAFLNYQRGRIMKDLGYNLSKGNEVLFAVYVAPIPSDNYRKFSNISKLILQALIDQEILSTAMCRLRVFTGMIPDKVLDKVDKSLAETIGNEEWLRSTYKILKEEDPTFKDELNIFEINHSIKRQLDKIGVDSELITILHRFGYSSSEFFNYFFDKKADFYWKKNANQILFNDFVKIFEVAGFTHGIVLFEELEKIIVPQTSLGRREFCEAMRYYFIDGDSSYNTQSSFYKILLTIHPYLQELLYPHWHASGLGRFAGLSDETSDKFTIYFNPIESPSAVPLAKAYLAESRIKGNQSDLEPFTEDSLSFALNKALGVPGKYLAFLHSAVEKAIEEEWTEININEIKSLSYQDTPKSENDDDDIDEGLIDSQVVLG